MLWFRRKKKQLGWVALSVDSTSLKYVHGVREPGGDARIVACGAVALEAGDSSLSAACGALSLNDYRCALLLHPDAYQMLQVDAPPNITGQEELKTAARWRIKDMIDWPVDQATIDVLPIPRPPNSGAEQLFVVAARNDPLGQAMRRFDEAGVALEVIDIVETAQRNISALFEDEGRAVAMLQLDDSGGLLTVTSGGDLYVMRRIDVSHRQLRERPEDARNDLFERILVELQRTLDAIERQYSFLSVSRVVVGPEPVESGLAEFLRNNLSLPVVAANLPDVMQFDGVPADAAAQNQLFPLFGAVLRQGATA